jgi:hypothetical protein
MGLEMSSSGIIIMYIIKRTIIFSLLALVLVVSGVIYFSIPIVYDREKTDLNVDYSDRFYELKQKQYLTEEERNEYRLEEFDYNMRFNQALEKEYGLKFYDNEGNPPPPEN